MSTVAFILATINTVCRWSKQSAKKNVLSIDRVGNFEATPKFLGMEDWTKLCKERTFQMGSKSFPVGVDFMACCYFSIDLWYLSCSCCCIIVASLTSLMIICSLSSRLFLTVSLKRCPPCASIMRQGLSHYRWQV